MVPDEAVSITRLLDSGWVAAPETHFRIRAGPGMWIILADLTADEIEPFSDDAIAHQGWPSI